MKSVSLIARQVSLVAASVIMFAGGAHLAATSIIDNQRSKQIGDMTDVVLRRAEAMVDFASSTLAEIAGQGKFACDPAALQTLRMKVYQRSAIKDIRLVDRDGTVQCSAYAETLEFDAAWTAGKNMLEAHDGAQIFSIPQIEGTALGVMRKLDANSSLVAVVSFNSYLFDILPGELRSRGDVRLELADGQVVGSFQPAETVGSLDSHVGTTRASTKYPFRAEVSIERTAFAAWNGELYWLAMFLVVGPGSIFGLMLARASDKTGPLADMDAALKRGEFKPYYQPTFDLKTGQIRGCEVLARWVKADGTVIPPAKFIPLAESSGRIDAMTWQILSAALAEMQPTLKADKLFKISVNIVPRHLVTEGFIEKLRSVVSEARVSPRQVVLELTEREELPDLAKASRAVAQLQELAFKVAMDDVGIGHSGLSQLKALGADVIKIDKFFVDSITLDDTAATIVETLVRMAHQLKMGVVAEGIETEEQREALIARGVESGQGYLVSAPVPFASFSELLKAKAVKSRDEVAMVA
jgi:sensor c-di-GMP phosphodiesterase-like protein